MFIDSHSHLDFKDYTNDLDEVIERAHSVDVKKIVTIALLSSETASVGKTLEIVKEYKNISWAVGIHPHDAKDGNTQLLNELERAIRNFSPIAVGEAGLDYYYDHSPRDVQKKIFRFQIELAIEHNLPLIIHTRSAEEDTVAILDEYRGEKLCGVFHCFTGDLKTARRYLEYETFNLSIPGVATFPQAKDLRNALQFLPKDRVMIETDAPFLTPVPYRGKRNEPSYVVKTAEMLSNIWNLPIEEIGNITSRNTERLFKI